jgi:hypothetical protein
MTFCAAKRACIVTIGLLAAPAAMAQTRDLATSGLWTTYTNAVPGSRPMCGIATVGPDARRISIEQVRGQTGLTLTLQKQTWAIPANTPIDMNVQFDGRAPTAARGIGSGQQVDVSMSFAQSVPFMHALRYGQFMQVTFPSGSEPLWTGGLAGSSRAIDAFNDCRSNLVSAVVTQPYTPLSSPNVPSNGPTQPFSTPLPPLAQPGQMTPTPPAEPPAPAATQPMPAPVPPAAPGANDLPPIPPAPTKG